MDFFNDVSNILYMKRAMEHDAAINSARHTNGNAGFVPIAHRGFCFRARFCQDY
jgi:hypothetical protein